MVKYTSQIAKITFLKSVIIVYTPTSTIVLYSLLYIVVYGDGIACIVLTRQMLQYINGGIEIWQRLLEIKFRSLST